MTPDGPYTQPMTREDLKALPMIAAAIALLWARWYSYLLFHALAEGFSIIIGVVAFVIAWHTRRFQNQGYPLFFGIAYVYVFVVILDFVHVLVYKGMGIFPGYGANPPTLLWIAARCLEEDSLLVSPLFLTHPLPVGPTFVAYAVSTAALMGAVFTEGVFPDCFTEEKGMIPSKITSEHIIAAVLLGAASFLRQRGREGIGWPYSVTTAATP